VSDPKRPIDHLLDLAFYAPLGFVLSLDEVVPQLVEKGHQQVAMARMFGQFAVDTGTKEVRKRVEHLADRGSSSAPSSASPSSEPAPERQPAVRLVATAAAPETAPVVPTAAAEDVPSSIELPITDYDSLSASQVVPRLDGLAPDERDAVRRYEAAHRGRKTILSKIAQLG
jgi:hypothetical protein